MIQPSAAFLRSALQRMHFLTKDDVIDRERKGQELLGQLVQHRLRDEVFYLPMEFEAFPCAMAVPETVKTDGIVLYLHGGGYCCGGLDYAKGFGAVLARGIGAGVCCPGYRLAPENPFPAALEDALETYRQLLKSHPAEKIALAGESAGGGLCYALCLKCKELGLPLPAGIVAISPWMDLTQSGASYVSNKDRDPTITKEKLENFAKSYTDTPAHPLVSPLFGDLPGLPESRIYVGDLEVLLDDSIRLTDRLQAADSPCRLLVAPDMWHGYIFYGLRERREDFIELCAFLREVLS